MAKWKATDIKASRRCILFKFYYLALYIKEIEKKNDKILNVVPKTRLERAREYEDKWPCLRFRKFLMISRV